MQLKSMAIVLGFLCMWSKRLISCNYIFRQWTTQQTMCVLQQVTMKMNMVKSNHVRRSGNYSMKAMLACLFECVHLSVQYGVL